MRHNRARPLWAIVPVFLVIAGCSPGTSSPGGNADVPSFEGAWQPELQQAWRDSTTDRQRGVLADGKISEAEVSELEGLFTSCMASKNLTVTWEPASAEFSVNPVQVGTVPPTDAQVEDAVKSCQRESQSTIVDLYYEMTRNPQHEDERELMAACLVRVKLVPAGYSAKDYERDHATDPKPAYFETQQYRGCVVDPKNAGK